MKCPFCKEQIQHGALKCRFCGEVLEQKSYDEVRNGPATTTVPAPVPNVYSTAQKVALGSLGFIAFLIVVSALGAFDGALVKLVGVVGGNLPRSPQVGTIERSSWSSQSAKQDCINQLVKMGNYEILSDDTRLIDRETHAFDHVVIDEALPREVRDISVQETWKCTIKYRLKPTKSQSKGSTSVNLETSGEPKTPPLALSAIMQTVAADNESKAKTHFKNEAITFDPKSGKVGNAHYFCGQGALYLEGLGSIPERFHVWAEYSMTSDRISPLAFGVTYWASPHDTAPPRSQSMPQP